MIPEVYMDDYMDTLISCIIVTMLLFKETQSNVLNKGIKIPSSKRILDTVYETEEGLELLTIILQLWGKNWSQKQLQGGG